MRGFLRDRRTFAAVLVGMVLVSVVIGAVRDDDSDDSPEGTPSIVVNRGSSPSETAPDPGQATGGPAYPTAVAPSHPVVDRDSGLQVVDLAELPPEAAQTVGLIEEGQPFRSSDDGETFLNSASLLPARETGYYQAYTVDDPGAVGPSLRRIVTGADGELYWTDDHYESFRRIEQ